MYRLWCLECDQTSVTGRAVEDALDTAALDGWHVIDSDPHARDVFGEPDSPRVMCPECAQAATS